MIIQKQINMNKKQIKSKEIWEEKKSEKKRNLRKKEKNTQSWGKNEIKERKKNKEVISEE